MEPNLSGRSTEKSLDSLGLEEEEDERLSSFPPINTMLKASSLTTIPWGGAGGLFGKLSDVIWGTILKGETENEGLMREKTEASGLG